MLVLQVRTLPSPSLERAWLSSYMLGFFTQSDGNLVDALSLAAWVALNTAVIPVVNLLADSSGKPHDFEISPGKEIGIPGAGKVPICISLCKVGQAFVADATAEEVRHLHYLLAPHFYLTLSMRRRHALMQR
jgi:hypothetical protein